MPDAQKSISNVEPFRATGPIATIDGREIAARRFNLHVLRRRPNARGGMPAEIVDQMKRRLVRRVVALELAVDEAEANDVSIPRARIDGALSEFQGRGTSSEDFEKFLERHNLAEADLRADFCRTLLVEQLVRNRADLEVGDDAVRTYYDENRAEFRVPPETKLRHLVVAVGGDPSDSELQEARDRARSLGERARSGDADFARLAREHSDASTAQKGGKLGWVRREQLPDAIADPVFSLEPAAISEPLRTEGGFHVVQVLDRRRERARPLDQVRDRIAAKIRDRRLQKAREQLLATLRDDAEVNYHFDRVEATISTRGGNGGDSLPVPNR